MTSNLLVEPSAQNLAKPQSGTPLTQMQQKHLHQEFPQPQPEHPQSQQNLPRPSKRNSQQKSRIDCDICLQQFRTEDEIRRHIRRYHKS